jgi:hypothetical protein
MSSVLELIQAVEAAGGRFMVDGSRLGIVPPSVAEPIVEELRRHKTELIAKLARRPAMPAGVRLVSWAPKEAPVQLSRCSTVTDVDKFIRSTLQQVEARLRGKDWLAGGWTLSILLERLEACGCFVKLDNPKQAVQ